MWTTLTHGFLYVYTGMVMGVTGSVQVVTNKVTGQAADWVLPCEALIDRALVTKTATNKLALGNVTMVKIAWENNTSNSYIRSEVTNWGSTNLTGTNVCSTNFYTNLYLYGKQEYSTINRYTNDPNGFTIASTNTDQFNMGNYVVAPLLWGGGLYTANALTTTVPTVLGAYQVSGQQGRYIYDWETNHWPYYATNDITTTNVIVMTNGTNIIELDRVFLNYDPTNQRPNAVTPLMGRSHVLAMDDKFAELVPRYYDDTKAVAGSFDNYCATTGVYWATSVVGAIWFENDNILSTTTSSYSTATANPVAEVFSVTTSVVSGTPENYTWVTNVEIGGSAEDFDRETTEEVPGTSLTPVEGWESHEVQSGSYPGTHTVSGEVAGSESDYTREVVTTNVLSSGGAEGSADDYNGTKTTSSSVPASTYSSTIISWTGVAGEGLDGEVDYHYAEIAGSENDYTRRVVIGEHQVVSSPYDRLTTSNHTGTGTPDHYNRISNSYNSVNSRTWVWAGVSNLLASYMTPWVVDHTNADVSWTTNSLTSGQTNYYDSYLYNHGWSPSYNTGWRIYTEVITPFITPHYYWDWTTTNFYKTDYQYFKTNSEKTAPPFHYPRSYSYYWKYPTEEIHTYYKNGSWEESIPITMFYTEWYGNTTVHHYFKNSNVYTLQVFTTNYVVKEPRYTVKYQVFPSNPPLYTLPSFLAEHTNLWGSTNWMLTPSYLSETQTFLSNWVHTVTNGVVVSSWTNNYFTNSVITNPPVFSNGWAMAMFGDSFVARYEAFTSLVWVSASGAITVESERRTLSTTSEVAAGWSSAAVTTNTVSAYTASISRGGYGSAYTFTKAKIRVRRKVLNVPFDGPIDVYMQFGQTLSGRKDLEVVGYPFGPYVRVDELCLATGDTVSEWLGDLTDAPAYDGDIVDYSWRHPWGFTNQNSSSGGTCVFKPEFN